MFSWNLQLAIVSTIVGLPIAYGSVFLIGGPILWHKMRQPIGAPQAMVTGAQIALLLQLMSILIGRVGSLVVGGGQVGGGDFTRKIGGVLTAYGWKIVGLETLAFVIWGSVIGLVIFFSFWALNIQGHSSDTP